MSTSRRVISVLLGGSAVPVLPPPLVCGYSLNSTLAQMQALGFDALLPVSNNGQTATFTVQGGLGTTNSAAVFTDFAAPQFLDFSTGRAAIEFGFSIPAGLDTVNSDIGIAGDIAIDGSHSITIASSNRNRSGVNTYGIVVAINGLLKYSDFTMTDPVTLVALLMDADAGTLTVYVNNSPTPVPLSSNSITPGHYVVGVQASEPDGIVAGDAGKEYICDIRTGAPYFQTTVLPAGTTDGCGNVIGA